MKNLLQKLIIFSFIIIPLFSFSQSQVFYGMSRYGGSAPNGGAIFQFNPGTNTETVVHNLGIGTDGGNPYGNLVYCPANGLFYAMTYYGGTNSNSGAIISLNPSNNTETLVWSFGGTSDGASPKGDLVYDTINNLFYGMTTGGGANNYGAIISFNPANNTESVVHDFSNTDGAGPLGALVYDNSTGLFYGVTAAGGINFYGAIISFNPGNNRVYVVWNFNNTSNNGSTPNSSLVLDPNNGLLYGTTSAGGANSYGTVFSFKPTTFTATVEWSFNNTGGSSHNGALIFQPTSGLFYGMTANGGANSYGTIFSFNPITNTVTVVWSFGSASDGRTPNDKLLLDASNGLFYGLTSAGGANNNGTIFKFNSTTSTEIVLYNFGAIPDAQTPYGSLVLAQAPNSIPTINKSIPSVDIYPNPNNGVFTVSTNNENSGAIMNTNGNNSAVNKLTTKNLVEVYNMLGEKVYTAPLNPPVGGISTTAISLPDGEGLGGASIYMLRIINADGTLLSAKKIVISR